MGHRQKSLPTWCCLKHTMASFKDTTLPVTANTSSFVTNSPEVCRQLVRQDQEHFRFACSSQTRQATCWENQWPFPWPREGWLEGHQDMARTLLLQWHIHTNELPEETRKSIKHSSLENDINADQDYLSSHMILLNSAGNKTVSFLTDHCRYFSSSSMLFNAPGASGQSESATKPKRVPWESMITVNWQNVKTQ